MPSLKGSVLEALICTTHPCSLNGYVATLYNGTTSQWGAVYSELCKKPKAKADAAQNIVLSNLFA